MGTFCHPLCLLVRQKTGGQDYYRGRHLCRSEASLLLLVHQMPGQCGCEKISGLQRHSITARLAGGTTVIFGVIWTPVCRSAYLNLWSSSQQGQKCLNSGRKHTWVKCFHCHKPGHKASHRPKSQKESPSYQQGEKTGRDKRNVTCYGCGRRGHYKPNCPNRPRQESTEEKTPKAPVKNNGDKSNKKVAIEKKEAAAVQQTSSSKEPVLYQRSQGQANVLTEFQIDLDCAAFTSGMKSWFPALRIV